MKRQHLWEAAERGTVTAVLSCHLDCSWPSIPPISTQNAYSRCHPFFHQHLRTLKSPSFLHSKKGSGWTGMILRVLSSFEKVFLAFYALATLVAY